MHALATPATVRLNWMPSTISGCMLRALTTPVQNGVDDEELLAVHFVDPKDIQSYSVFIAYARTRTAYMCSRWLILSARIHFALLTYRK